jgi:hypothetical protein
MKKVIPFIVTALFSMHVLKAQNVGVNSTGAVPDASAMMDIASANSGMLIPRVALTAINAAGPVTAPANSLLVYNTATAGTNPNNVTPGYYYWESATNKWQRLISGSYLNSASITAIGKFYSTLSWTGTWANNTYITFVITDPNMVCAANASVAFVSFDCTNSNATMGGFTIRNVKCNAGNIVITVVNNTGTSFGTGGLPITYAAFY